MLGPFMLFPLSAVATLTAGGRPARGRGCPVLSAVLSVVVGLVLAGPSPAVAELTIDRIEPGGGPRGAELEIALAGKEFADPEQLWFEDGAITVVSLTPVDATHVKATIRIPADCPPGPHRFRLRTKHGLSELRTFRVGFLPQAAETEPNNDPAAAVAASGPAPLPAEGRTIAGVVKGEDVDCFPVRAAAGERISVAIDAVRLDQEMFDPAIDIVDERGFVLAAADDHPLLGQDAMLSATAPADGTYFVRVRESAYGGNDGCLYLLHLGRFPTPHSAWPPGGRPGEAIEVEWLGDSAGPFRSKIVLPERADHAGLVEVRPERDGVASPVAVPFRIAAVPATVETEPNDDPGKASRVSAPAAVIGRMNAADDVDWIRVEAPKGSTWRVRGRGRRLGSPIDLVMNVHRDDEKREKLTGNDDTDGPDCEAKVKTPDQGSFLIRLNDHRQRGGDAFIYWIDVEPVEPSVTVSVPPGRTNTQERLVASVPRGNRTAVVFNTARNECDDTVQLAFEGLPAGVRAITSPIVSRAPAGVVVFEAAADAAGASSMAGVAVRTVPEGGGEPQARGGMRQVTELVFGQPNNATYRTSVSDRLPVAVIDPARVRVELQQPAVPLVRRGSLELRVKVDRESGFTGRIKLGFPFKPPGIGAPPAVEIGEKESEAVYPLNATPDAAVGEWQVVVTAAAKDKDDPSGWVSSLPVTLRVAEPLIEIAADKATTEPGQETKIVCKVTKPASYEGKAKVKLMGLPAKTQAPELEIAADATEFSFPVTVAADASPGRHENIFCQVSVPMAGTWVVHATPGTHLRIDKPLPKPAAKPDAPAKPATDAVSAGNAATTPAPKENGT